MKKIFIFLLWVVFFIDPSPTLAIVDPLAVPNNKYGIHIVDENDLYDAANLVNSQGGDWGYVTIVIRDDDRDVEKWQKTFDLMRSWHLIPIIRIATHLNGDTWEKPAIESAPVWTSFLSRLNWPTKNRYLVIFNEPNHAKEWGGSINPAEYAQILATFSQNLKRASSDFFILPAGLDASAPNGNLTMDEVGFIKEMIKSLPNIFSFIDGWTSHSYPNPGFSGKVTDNGRGTLRTYQWELEIIKSLAQGSDLPVFITETGWAHNNGIPEIKTYYSPEIISDFIRETAKNIWNDPEIVAVTPFILNYQAYPFAYFSWRKVNEESFYPHYDTYRSLPKTSGKPVLNSAFGNFNGLKLQNLTTNYTAGITNFWRSLFYSLFKL